MSSKIIAIHSGGDWADACAEYVSLPTGVTIQEEEAMWQDWYENIYLKQFRSGIAIKFKTLVDSIVEHGGKIPSENELEIFYW